MLLESSTLANDLNRYAQHALKREDADRTGSNVTLLIEGDWTAQSLEVTQAVIHPRPSFEAVNAINPCISPEARNGYQARKVAGPPECSRDRRS